MLQWLQKFDHQENLYMGGHGDVRKIHDDNGPCEIYFHSGGSGFLLSNSAMKAIYPYISQWINQWSDLCKPDSRQSYLDNACDIAIAYFLTKYNLAKIIKTDSFRACNWKGYVGKFKCCGKNIPFQDLLSCHYMNPVDMDKMFKSLRDL